MQFPKPILPPPPKRVLSIFGDFQEGENSFFFKLVLDEI